MIGIRMIYLVAVSVILGLGFVGWKLTARGAYESAEYTLLSADGSIEIREYPDLMLVTTDMGRRSRGEDGSFMRLFQYISGANDAKQKVAMTTPVFMDENPNDTQGQMGFVIPKKVALHDIPRPVHDEVQLTRRPGGKFAVIRFSGRIDEEVIELQRNKLQEWIREQGLAAVGNEETAGYDPPWTPGPFRRNELLIRLDPESPHLTALVPSVER